MSSFSIAQNKFLVKGKLVKKDGRPLPYATVILNSNTGDDTTAYSDYEGFFEINNIPNSQKKYNLKVILFDEVLYKKMIEPDSQNLNLGTIEVDDAVQMKGVVLSGEKKVFEIKPDRIVFNVSKIATSTGGDMFDVVKKIPGIIIDHDDNINVVGKGVAAIAINGKILRVTKDQINTILKGLNMKTVSNVEVIHSPSAKYSAQGASAIINITTTQSTESYFNANSKTSYSTYFLNNIAASYNYSGKNINVLFSINGDYGHTFNKNSFLVTYPDYSQIDWYFFIKKKNQSMNGSLQLDYDINPSTFVGFIYRGNFSFPILDNINILTPTDRQNNRNIVSRNKTNGSSKINHSLSLNFNKKYKNTNINIVADVLDFDLTLDNNLNISAEGVVKSHKQYSNRKISNYTFNLDLKTTFDKTTFLEYGAKFFKNKTHSLLDFYDGDDSGGLSKVTRKSDVFSYNEHVEAVYVSLNSIYKKIHMRLGMRLEHTATKGNSASGDVVNRNYTNWFPNVSIAYKTPQNHAVSLNYNRRLNRPSFSDLNPFKNYISDNSYTEGNPFLNPSYTSKLELTYKYKKLMFSPYFSWTTNAFGQIFTTSEDDELFLFTRANFYDFKDYGLSIMYTLNPYKFWTSMLNIKVFGYSFDIYPTISTTDKLNDGVAYFIYNRNSFLLNSKGTLVFELSFWYQSAMYVNFYGVDALYNFSLGLKYNPGKSISLSLDINDIFAKTYPKIRSNIGGTNQNGVLSGYDSKRINLSLNYSPSGKKDKKLKVKSGNQSQLNRLKQTD